ncbi:MAG: hypothetical protein ACLT8Y_12605 [Dorea formicigenerans]
MAKWGKKLLGLAAIGGAAAGLVYYLKSKEELDLDDFDDELDDDDFDLDNDLKPVGERGYVPLTPKKRLKTQTLLIMKKLLTLLRKLTKLKKNI